MPKSLVLSNGNLLVGYDQWGQVDDFYYEFVGVEDHMGEDGVNRVGVWVDGQMSWLSDKSWDIKINYGEETLSAKISAVNSHLQITLEFSDVVYNEKNIFVRKIVAANKANYKREVKVYLGHEFRMYGIPKGDTVYFDPNLPAIVHYKARRIAIVTGNHEGRSFDDWAVGLSGIEGREGTWKDAEDGDLTNNPIEHGVVDSTIGYYKTVDAGESFTFYTWVAMGKTYKEARALSEYVKEKTSEHLLDSTQDFWHEWVNKNDFTFYGLDDRLIDLFKKSLLIVRTHVGNEGGIVASSDSDLLQYGRDKYSYVWPRDGAFVALALDQAGYSEVTHNFYEFINDVISEDGYLLHKYRNDRSLGSSWHPWFVNGMKRLPIQEDETALVVYALRQHYEYSKDLEFIEKNYNTFIKRAADFMVRFRGKEGLPRPSYDLWEMKYGIHTFTVAATYGALMAAGDFAHILGKEEDEEQYIKAADSMKESALKYMYNEREKFFYKYIEFDGKEVLHDETLDTSSFYGMFKFGLLPSDSPMMEEAHATLLERLVCKSRIGGVVRFEGDGYYRSHPEVPGNPWVVTTLWLAQYYISLAEGEGDMEKVLGWFNWVADRALPSGILSEQFDPYTGVQLSAAPLTWSHSEYVSAVISYLEKLSDLGVCDVCRIDRGVGK